MKIHNRLDSILNHGSKIKILRFLFNEQDEHTGRGIAKAIGMSASTTYETLQNLKSEGLVNVRKKGNALLYKLQKDNYVVKKLFKPLFKEEKSIYDNLIAIIKKTLLNQGKNIISIAVFGSVAKKEEAAKSDIDLLIIAKGKNGKEQIDKVLDTLYIDIAKKFSASLSPYILTLKEFRRKHKQKKPVIKAILNNNRLIYGEPIERILA